MICSPPKTLFLGKQIMDTAYLKRILTKYNNSLKKILYALVQQFHFRESFIKSICHNPKYEQKCSLPHYNGKHLQRKPHQGQA